MTTGREEHPRRPAHVPGGITTGHPTHDPDILTDRLWTSTPAETPSASSPSP